MLPQLTRELSKEMNLCQPMTVHETVIGFHRRARQLHSIEMLFPDHFMNLYNWHQALGPYIGEVVREYDRLRKDYFIIARRTNTPIIIPGEDAHITDRDAVKYDVHRTLDWLAPEYNYHLAHRFFEDLADRLQDSNKALAEHTLLMCFGLIPVPG